MSGRAANLREVKSVKKLEDGTGISFVARTVQYVALIWRVILTFFQKTFFGTTFSPLLLIKPCELLRTPGLIINKDLIGNTKGIA
jgi:hypothetical protein